MPFVHFDEHKHLCHPDGVPFYLTGTNYVASYVCTNFLDDWRPDIIYADLKEIARLGLNAVRVPIYWGFFEPEEKQFNETAFTRLDAFLDMCRELKLYVMPWCLVGVATKWADVPYRQGRPFLTGHMLFAAQNHLRQLGLRYKDEEQLLCWDIVDEPEFYSMLPNSPETMPYNPEDFNHWLEHMYQGFRQADPNHIITSGFGQLLGFNYGYKVRDTAAILDCMVLTTYPIDSAVEGLDTMRNNYYLSYYARMHSQLGRPVFACEAPGYSTVLFGREQLGRYFTASIYSALLNDSRGVMPWVWNDFDPSIQEDITLENAPAEPYFGMMGLDGHLKPNGQALVDFAAFARQVDAATLDPHRPRVCVSVTDTYYGNMDVEKERLWVAHQALRGCGLEMDFRRDDEDLSAYEAVLVPSISPKTSAWRKLESYVEAGGNAAYFYDGSWSRLAARTNRVLGVEVQNRQRNYGLKELRFEADFGPWKAGETAALTQVSRPEYLKVTPTTGAVIARFENGDPAIVENKLGKGRALFIAMPLLDKLYDLPYERYVRDMAFPLIEAIAARFGVTAPLKADCVQVEAGLLARDGADALLLAVNHAPYDLDCRVALPEGLADRLTGCLCAQEARIEPDCLTLRMKAGQAQAFVIGAQ